MATIYRSVFQAALIRNGLRHGEADTAANLHRLKAFRRRVGRIAGCCGVVIWIAGDPDGGSRQISSRQEGSRRSGDTEISTTF